MINDKVLAMLSMAAKAGKISSGAFMVEKAIKSGMAFLVIIAGDASDNTKHKFNEASAYYEIPVYEYSDSQSLGHYVGKEFRMVLAVTDEGFAKSIASKIDNIDLSNGGNRIDGKNENS